MKHERLYTVVTAISPVLVICLWEGLVRTGAISAIFLPPPSLILGALIHAFRAEDISTDLLVSSLRLVSGFLAGAGLALGCAFAMNLSRPLRWFLSPFMSLLYPIPKVALYPLLVIWLGTGDTSKVLLIATGAFFPVLINTYRSLNDVPLLLVRAARDLGANKRQVLLRVALPWALPSAYAGGVIGAGLSLIMLVYAEMTGAERGIGYYTYSSATLFKTEEAFAGVLLIALLGFFWYQLVVRLQKIHCPWKTDIRL